MNTIAPPPDARPQQQQGTRSATPLPGTAGAGWDRDKDARPVPGLWSPEEALVGASYLLVSAIGGLVVWAVVMLGMWGFATHVGWL